MVVGWVEGGMGGKWWGWWLSPNFEHDDWTKNDQDGDGSLTSFQ